MISCIFNRGPSLLGLGARGGRAGAIFGPLMVGTLLALYGDVRIALLPIAVLFILGGLVLLKVRESHEV